MYELDEAPQTEDDEQRGELALAAAEHDLEHERRGDDDGVEEVQRGVRHAAERVELLHALRPDRDRNFDEEEGGDGERDLGEDVEPERGLGPLDGRAVGGEEGVGEVGEDTGRVNEDLSV